MHDRQKSSCYRDAELDALDQALSVFDTVVFFLAHAHFGVTINEWADQMAGDSLQREVVPTPMAASRHLSLRFGNRTSAAQQAGQMMQEWIVERLAAHTVDTLWRAPTDLRLPARSSRDEEDLHVFLGRRWFPGDKRLCGEVKRRMDTGLCPCCGVRCQTNSQVAC